MKRSKTLLVLALILSVTISPVSKADGRGTIASCIKLLPVGFKYRLILETDIDTNEAQQELVWNILMHDEKKEELSDAEDDRRDKEIEPFIECMLPLIK